MYVCMSLLLKVAADAHIHREYLSLLAFLLSYNLILINGKNFWCCKAEAKRSSADFFTLTAHNRNYSAIELYI